MTDQDHPVNNGEQNFELDPPEWAVAMFLESERESSVRALITLGQVRWIGINAPTIILDYEPDVKKNYRRVLVLPLDASSGQ